MDVSLSELREMVMDREAWPAAIQESDMIERLNRLILQIIAAFLENLLLYFSAQ